MEKTMSIIRSDLVIPLLALLGVILVAVAIMQPWWSFRTSPELQLLSNSNSTMTIDANLFKTLNVARTDGTQTDTLAISIVDTSAYRSPASVPVYPFSFVFRNVTASRTDGNYTSAFTFSLSNTTDFEQQTRQISETSSMALPLIVAGLMLSIVTLLLISVVTRTKMALERYAYLVGVLSTIVLLIAPLQLTFYTTSFSGSFAIKDKYSIWKGDILATWGPSIGWYLTIAAALIMVVCLLSLRTMCSDRRRGIQSLK
jgi:hypothetical protein